MSKLWSEFHDLRERETRIEPTFQGLRLNPKLADLATGIWKENFASKGWKSSWIPNLDRMTITEDEVIIKAGITRYGEQVGIMEAVKQNQEKRERGQQVLDFVPEIGVNGLGITIYTVTRDGKIILPRKSTSSQDPYNYNTFGGWMSSMNLVGFKGCEDMHLINDPRLYDAFWQAREETKEESGLEESEFDLCNNPSFMIRAFGGNRALSYIARIKVDSIYVVRKMIERRKKRIDDIEEHDLIATVDVNELEQLLINQPQLQKEDPRSFKPKDPRELILLNETFGGLVLMYKELTGMPKPKNLVDHLRKEGVEIVERSTTPGTYVLE